MKTKYIFFVMFFTVLLNAPFAFSNTLEGTIVSVRPGLLIINVGGDNLQADLKLEHATEIEYFDTLDSLNFGDWVNIRYQRKDNRMIAASIIKEMKGPGEF